MREVDRKQNTVHRGHQRGDRRQNTANSEQGRREREQDTADGGQEIGPRKPRKAQTFQDLVVWQKAHALALDIYRASRALPAEERFGLVSQMRRAAVSVPANIAEGFKKRGQKDKANFYNIAQGSLEELRYYIILSNDLGYLTQSDGLLSKLDEVGRMLHALVSALRA